MLGVLLASVTGVWCYCCCLYVDSITAVALVVLASVAVANRTDRRDHTLQ